MDRPEPRECRHCYSDALIAVHKWMVLGQAFPKRSGFLNSDAIRAAESSDQTSVDGDPLRPRSGIKSLGQTAEQFWVLVDELVNGREKR